jgi:hypothetical protein
MRQINASNLANSDALLALKLKEMSGIIPVLTLACHRDGSAATVCQRFLMFVPRLSQQVIFLNSHICYEEYDAKAKAFPHPDRLRSCMSPILSSAADGSFLPPPRPP